MNRAIAPKPAKKGYANNQSEDSAKNLQIGMVMISLFVFVILIGKIMIQNKTKMIFKRNLQDL